MKHMNDLEQARAKISQIDKEMAALFEQRMNAAETIGLYKKEKALAIKDAEREAQLIDQNVKLIASDAVRPYYIRFLENMFSLSDAAELFRKMYRGELVSPEASREMCALLQNQQYTYKMPFFIRRIPIAHKTGEDTGIENDVGIVFSDKPFIFCFASNEADEPEAVRLCQDLARELEVHHG